MQHIAETYNLRSCQNAPHVLKVVDLISPISFFYKAESSREDYHKMRKCNWNVLHLRPLLRVSRPISCIVCRPRFRIARKNFSQSLEFFVVQSASCDFGRFAPICHVKKMRIFHFYKSPSSDKCVSRSAAWNNAIQMLRRQSVARTCLTCRCLAWKSVQVPTSSVPDGNRVYCDALGRASLNRDHISRSYKSY